MPVIDEALEGSVRGASADEPIDRGRVAAPGRAHLRPLQRRRVAHHTAST